MHLSPDTHLPAPQLGRWSLSRAWLCVVNDQAFKSFAIFPSNDQTIITTSSRVDKAWQMRSTAQSGSATPVSKDQPSGKAASVQIGKGSIESEPVANGSTERLQSLALLGTALSVGGYIVQFVGLRGMHWSASVVQLGAIAVMTVLRALARRGLATPPRSEPLTKGFELDWFAMSIGDVDKAPWNDTPRQTKMPQNNYPRKDWRILTGRNTLYEPLKQVEKNDDSQQNIADTSNAAHAIMMIRESLGNLAQWPGPASAEAIALARAMEITMDALFEHRDTNLSWAWTLEARYSQRAKEPIEAALSLWLYSVDEVENEVPQASEWLLAKGINEQLGLRLLGQYTESLHRDLQWWMPHGTAGIKKFNKMKRDLTRLSFAEADESSTGSGPGRLAGKDTTESKQETVINKDDSKRGSEKLFLARETVSSLALLYAQDMFSAFMWAMVKTLSDPIGGDAEIRLEDNADIESWQSFTLKHTRLLKMTQEVSDTGIGTMDQVFLAIIPPLSGSGKLPKADGLVELARQHAKPHEKTRHWRAAGEVYLGLFRVAKTFPEDSSIRIRAISVLIEYLRTVTLTLKLRQEQKDEIDLGELEDIQQMLASELCEVDTSLLDRFKQLDKAQGCEWEFNLAARIKANTDKMALPIAYGRSYRDNFNVSDLHRSLLLDDNDGPLHWLSHELSKATRDDATAADIRGWSPLHYAAETGKTPAVGRLLKLGTNVNAKNILEWTPLHCASKGGHVETLRALIREGAELDAQGRDGVSPLHCAAINGHRDAACALVEAGASIDIIDASGTTPLLWAAYKGRENVFEYLRPNANINLRDHHGRTCLSLAALSGAKDVVESLLDQDIDKLR
ncbi:unnamed protein product [Parascedosporium putredinis]|uniref:Ankyrin n=1 Tax=Parascedosporium putredinis TaxID=1442378 RepID=A0A9P1M9C1_9PEZI|nr:unnamed protein product [Parascedosporium putredinis]CAI7994364.1 unnamed protein product [Parascedosporium putredinis]